MNRFMASIGALCLAIFIVSCGGGGGGEGGAGSSGISLSPESLKATLRPGLTYVLTVDATAADPSVYAGGVYVVVVDPTHLLSGSGSHVLSSSTVAVSLYTSDTLAPGHYQGSFQVRLCRSATCASEYPASPLTLPYDLTVAPLPASSRGRLQPSEWAVGFAATPSGTRLTRTLTVNDNLGTGLAWTATSDSAWLSVTPSGTTGTSSLTLTVDPAALPSGGLSQARAPPPPPTTGIDPQVVRVALWKDATGLVSLVRLPMDLSGLVADPLRPYVYAIRGGSIDAYNAYTAQKIATVANVGTALVRLAVSPDGSRLFALDGQSAAMRVIDLDTFAVSATWQLAAPATTASSLIVLHPDGKEVVLATDGHAYVDGRSAGTRLIEVRDSAGASDTLAASGDARSVVVQENGGTPISRSVYDFSYSESNGGTVTALRRGFLFTGDDANGSDVAMSRDGRNVYSAGGSPYRCEHFDASALKFVDVLPGGAAYPNNVEVTADGRVLCGVSSSSPGTDFWLHAADGSLLRSYSLSAMGSSGTLRDRSLVTTPDGFIAIGLTAGAPAAIAFLPIGP